MVWTAFSMCTLLGISESMTDWKLNKIECNYSDFVNGADLTRAIGQTIIRRKIQLDWCPTEKKVSTPLTNIKYRKNSNEGIRQSSFVI